MKETDRIPAAIRSITEWEADDQEQGGEKHIEDLRQVIVPHPVPPPLPTAVVEGCDYVVLSSVEAKETRWLWPGHIPFGALTLLIGDPGLGKSQLTLDLIARVTRGAAWPDGHPQPYVGNVLMISSEDSMERTVLPRLRASGAYLNRVVGMTDVVERSKRRMFNLKTDLEVLEMMIEKHFIDVIVMDPLNGYLGNTNSWKESDVRNVLGPLCLLMDKKDVALIGVVHLNKDNTRAAIHRVLGSVAFAAVTRSMFAVAQHPGAQSQRYFVSVKQNYCAQPATMKFSMIPGGGIDWDPNPATDVTADNLLAVTGAPEEKAQRRNARAFLLTLLASGGGAVKTSEIVRAKEAAMISDRALQQAKYDLKIEAVHVGSPTGTGIGGYWMWKLP